MSNRISKHIEILVPKGVDSYRGHGMSIRKLRAGDRSVGRVTDFPVVTGKVGKSVKSVD